MASKRKNQAKDLAMQSPNDHSNVDSTDDLLDEDERDHVIQAIDELADRGLEIEKLKEELEQSTDQLKRQAAEFQNYRRRTEQEKSQAVSLGKSIVIQTLLDVVDDFYRSLEATNQAEAETEGDLSPAYLSLKSGVELVYQKLMKELSKLNVTVMETLGQPFNEAEHEALMQQPAEEGQEAGIVISELQRGFRMGDKVLRHARVIVSA
ncbi:nucleotide exchange factor GrpE [bacterium]|nr:nucleotide exchange factor GrpE [bacterium]